MLICRTNLTFWYIFTLCQLCRHLTVTITYLNSEQRDSAIFLHLSSQYIPNPHNTLHTVHILKKENKAPCVAAMLAVTAYVLSKTSLYYRCGE